MRYSICSIRKTVWLFYIDSFKARVCRYQMVLIPEPPMAHLSVHFHCSSQRVSESELYELPFAGRLSGVKKNRAQEILRRGEGLQSFRTANFLWGDDGRLLGDRHDREVLVRVSLMPNISLRNLLWQTNLPIADREFKSKLSRDQCAR